MKKLYFSSCATSRSVLVEILSWAAWSQFISNMFLSVLKTICKWAKMQAMTWAWITLYTPTLRHVSCAHYDGFIASFTIFPTDFKTYWERYWRFSSKKSSKEVSFCNFEKSAICDYLIIDNLVSHNSGNNRVRNYKSASLLEITRAISPWIVILGRVGHEFTLQIIGMRACAVAHYYSSQLIC